EAASELAAREAGLSFIKLDGTVGCCVNGAGLAMATMDLVKYYGGEPANFLDIGGSSNPQKVVAALRIITADPSVRAILFNIFVDQETRLLVQGITGRDGSFHTRQMISYGTKVVAGVTPGKGGQLFDGVVPVFDTVADALRETNPTCSVIYVPAAVAASAILEAADAGLPLVVGITE